jgi:hypothetical protein
MLISKTVRSYSYEDGTKALHIINPDRIPFLWRIFGEYPPEDGDDVLTNRSDQPADVIEFPPGGESNVLVVVLHSDYTGDSDTVELRTEAYLDASPPRSRSRPTGTETETETGTETGAGAGTGVGVRAFIVTYRRYLLVACVSLIVVLLGYVLFMAVRARSRLSGGGSATMFADAAAEANANVNADANVNVNAETNVNADAANIAVDASAGGAATDGFGIGGGDDVGDGGGDDVSTVGGGGAEAKYPKIKTATNMSLIGEDDSALINDITKSF